MPAAKMQATIKRAGIIEVTTSGDFMLGANNVVLFAGSAYGFAACLTEDEKRALFNEASQKRSHRP